ncbi:MAG: TlpA family protein disulfide reductase [Anaerolineae bacterium]
MKNGVFGLSLIVAVTLAACGGTTGPVAVEQPAPAVEAVTVVEQEPAQEETSAGEAVTLPAWFTAELTAANTGETFKVADLQGKVILVETMAVWCPVCTQQQREVRVLHRLIGERDDFVSLSLDIDPNETAGDLQQHTSRNGFKWPFVVAPPEVAREIGQLYGRGFLSPPSAPMFVIDRRGEVHPLPFGVKGSLELQEAVERYLNEG